MKYFIFFTKFLVKWRTMSCTISCVTKRERTLQSKSWINKEIKHLMLKRDKLFWKYCACKNETQK